mmetsp:Transcript_105229/g.172912  ORF Transcript_105229/g.172912 Transcript_105229/m.172912 type:complete len:84 (+) Transcript_105229:67-318(+)
MRSIISSQAARSLFTLLQVVILAAFVGVVAYSLMAMEGDMVTTVTKTLDKSCVRKTWLILPFAFLTGGLMNIDGFASTAVLLL